MEVDRQEVLGTRAFFSGVQLWPAIPLEADPEGWLKNFEPDELECAEALLDSFVYLNGRLTRKMFRSAVASIAATLTQPAAKYEEVRSAWTDFLHHVIVTFPGAGNSPTDSGMIFARQVRDQLSIPEERIVPNADAVQKIQLGARAVLIVDDIVATGDQFMEFMQRVHNSPYGAASLGSLSTQIPDLRIFYATVLATSRAVSRLAAEASEVTLSSAHVLPDEYTATSQTSILVPERLVSTTKETIAKASSRLGLSEQEALGYGGLGLAVGFEHGIPDCTLPIFSSEVNGWTPLIARH